MGFLSLGVALFAGVDVGCAVACEEAACDGAVCGELAFAAVVFDGVDFWPLCFSVGRSGSSAGAGASGALWFVSAEDGVGVGEPSGDAVLSERCRVGRSLSDDSGEEEPEAGLPESAGVGEGVALLSGRRSTGRSLSDDDDVEAGALEDESLPVARCRTGRPSSPPELVTGADVSDFFGSALAMDHLPSAVQVSSLLEPLMMVA